MRRPLQPKRLAALLKRILLVPSAPPPSAPPSKPRELADWEIDLILDEEERISRGEI
jgi:hypothetical protein